MDTLNLVTFDANRHKTIVYPITAANTREVVRDTFKTQVAKNNDVMATSDRRYGGARTVGQSHDNGTIEFELYINGGSMDASVAMREALLGAIESSDVGQWIEFRREGSSRSAYFELRGPASYTDLDEWIVYSQKATLHSAFILPVSPLAYGDPMDIYDDFAVNTTADYTADVGTLGTSYSWSAAAPSEWSAGAINISGADVLLHHTGRGYTYGDVETTIKFTTHSGAFVNGETISVIGSMQDANNYLAARVQYNGTSWVFTIIKRDGGVESVLSTAGVGFNLAASTAYYLSIREEGNIVYAAISTQAPTNTVNVAANSSSWTYTLTGADATKFGTGQVGGYVGFRITGSTGTGVNAFRAEPYTYTEATNIIMGSTIDAIGDVPGTAPALGSIDVTGITNQASWFIGSWIKRLRKTGIANSAGSIAPGTVLAPFGALPAGAATIIQGSMAQSASGGQAWSNFFQYATSVSTTTPYVWSWTIDPTLVPRDDFSNVLTLEVWARLFLNYNLISPRLLTSIVPTVETYVAPQYSMEYGASGKAITNLPSSASASFVWVRAGTFTIPAGLYSNTEPLGLRMQLSMVVGSGGAAGFDIAYVVPARQRALLPTSKHLDSTYPKLLGNTVSNKNWRVKFDSDLSGRQSLNQSVTTNFPPPSAPTVGLGGQLIEIPPGTTSFTSYVSNLVPDDPTPGANIEGPPNGGFTAPTGFRIHWGITPRYYLGR